MNIRRYIIRLAALVGLAFLAGAPAAYAATQTTTFQVQASVDGTCSVSTTGPLLFGAYDGTIKLKTSTNLDVNCTGGIPVDVMLGYGLDPNGTQRRLANSGHYLNYQLAHDAPCSQPWNNDLVTALHYAAIPAGHQITPIYGCIPKNQDASAMGVYSDSVVVTVNFP